MSEAGAGLAPVTGRIGITGGTGFVGDQVRAALGERPISPGSSASASAKRICRSR